MDQTSVSDKQVEFTDDGLKALILNYTRESGVRNLEREVGNVCRKVTRQYVGTMPDKETAKEAKESGKEAPKETKKGNKFAKVLINSEKVGDLLGPIKFRDTQA